LTTFSVAASASVSDLQPANSSVMAALVPATFKNSRRETPFRSFPFPAIFNRSFPLMRFHALIIAPAFLSGAKFCWVSGNGQGLA
jgi:hypothetical protein